MQKILACVDESRSSEYVADWAAWLALRTALPIKLLHVLERVPSLQAIDQSGALGLGTSEALLSQLTQLDEARGKIAMEHGKALLQALDLRLAEHGGLVVESSQRHGNLLETLAELESEMAMLVIGRRGEHSQDSVTQIGSNLESSIRAIPRPALVAVSTFKAPTSLLLAYDGSDNAQKIVDFILLNPKLFDKLTCHLVHVGEALLPQIETAKSKLSLAGFDLVTNLLEGDFESAVLRYVDDHGIDLVLMGAYGHSAIRRFVLGSHTTRMLQQTKVPLLLVR